MTNVEKFVIFVCMHLFLMLIFVFLPIPLIVFTLQENNRRIRDKVNYCYTEGSYLSVITEEGIDTDISEHVIKFIFT